ncbi:MAG: putative Ig domain-containing protein [Acidobacteria bacterium]|nr:putative Ig domain-containing protein [Acidobacteriota bacterium]
MPTFTRPSHLPLAFILVAGFSAFTAAHVFAQAPADVAWTHMVHATANGPAVQKTGGCNGCPDAGATSVQALTTGDGYVEFIPTLGGRLLAGLGSTYSSATDPALIDFAFNLWPDGGWDIRERSVYRSEGRFSAGDVFRIALQGGQVKYYRNASLVYASTVAPSLPLVLDTTLISAGATITGVRITASSPTPAPASTYAPLTIHTTTLPGGTAGQPYTALLEASGGNGTRTWSIAAGSLPTGLVVAASTGAVGGTPASHGTATFTARVTDGVSTAEQSLQVAIAAASLVMQTTALPNARLNQSYSAAITVTGGTGALTWSLAAGGLPQGLTLNAASGVIAGTPTVSGRREMTIKAMDQGTGETVERAMAIEVVSGQAPSTYEAITDRQTRSKGPLVELGSAGHVFHDPVFGTRLRRVTDGATRPDAPDRSYRTPSATHSNAWSADGRYFYTVSTDGTSLPYAFDAATMTATRLEPTTTGAGGRTLRFFAEPTFSYVTPGLLYGTYNGAGSNLRSVDQYDIETKQYRSLLNLDTLVPGLEGTYAGGLLNSGGATERLVAFFGGTSQDRHMYLVVFDKADPSKRRLVDTLASTVDGAATNILLHFSIHATAIDRSGRFVTIYPTGGDLAAPRSAAPAYVWDLTTNTFTATPLVQTRSGGHDAYGYGVRVNQDCCTSSSWDAAQWQFRSLAKPLVTSDLIAPVLQPKAVYLSDHPSWHNAEPDRLVPFLDATYRYGANTTAWRAWDDEIIAVQTDQPATGGAVWRFAHHRSNVAHDNDPSRISFWYTPRVNVSPDGRWALFTSNWEKTLGTDPRGDAGGAARQDLFLIELRQSAVAAPVTITTTALPSGTAQQLYTATLAATGGSGTFSWSVVGGVLPSGLALNAGTGVIAGTPTQAGTSDIAVRVVDLLDGNAFADRALTITIHPAPLPPASPVVITTTALPDAPRDVYYQTTLLATGGTPPVTWSIVSGALPKGLVLNPTTGVISGVAQDQGMFKFTVSARDGSAQVSQATRALSLKVNRR